MPGRNVPSVIVTILFTPNRTRSSELSGISCLSNDLGFDRMSRGTKIYVKPYDLSSKVQEIEIPNLKNTHWWVFVCALERSIHCIWLKFHMSKRLKPMKHPAISKNYSTL
ncbi:hypothetical protein TNIN_95561 [Trichonephila inaurata madagascariensis]|uniref:Uncharacterized protein n=1 Tax=Trichonephila inaurata madagascariensis TaxID=2747483 RepID=A0A8X6XII5_9ARAC|nr:hypothetical protein TNIN_95561 [Trichonephila inaurata madagascariensis]